VPVTDDEYAAFLTMLDDPDAAVMSYLLLSTWGTRPR